RLGFAQRFANELRCFLSTSLRFSGLHRLVCVELRRCAAQRQYDHSSMTELIEHRDLLGDADRVGDRNQWPKQRDSGSANDLRQRAGQWRNGRSENEGRVVMLGDTYPVESE